MKVKLIMLFAAFFLALAATETKAQNCLGFKVDNSVSTCTWSYTLQWTCGSNIITVNNTVAPGAVNFEANPGTWPNCCTFFRIAIYDQCGGPALNLWSGNTSGTLCDCNSNTANFTLSPIGTTFQAMIIN